MSRNKPLLRGARHSHRPDMLDKNYNRELCIYDIKYLGSVSPHVDTVTTPQEIYLVKNE